MLSDQKTAILMNILWMLLIHDNPGYQPVVEDPRSKFINRDTESNLLYKKSLEDDIAMFKELVLMHSTGVPESQIASLISNHQANPTNIKIFEPEQVRQIVKYAHTAFMDKFNLYKYVFENKKKNEEVAF